MSPSQLFSLAGAAVLPGWLILLVFPRWRWGARLIVGALIPALLAVAYAVLILPNFFGAEGGFGSIEDVRTLFGNDALLAAGWIHYLAFDLFIGAWIVRDAQRLNISHWFVVPCLPLTFMFGPVGLLLYLALRWGGKRHWELGHNFGTPEAEPS